MSDHTYHHQVCLANVMTEARVTFKRRYHHVEFPDFGVSVRVGQDVRVRGAYILRDHKAAAHEAVRHLEALPAEQLQPVLRQALASGREGQTWAVRKLGIPLTGRLSDAVKIARAQVGEQPFHQHREEWEARRAGRSAAKRAREDEKRAAAKMLSQALDTFFASDEWAQLQEANRQREAEWMRLAKAEAQAATPEARAEAREARLRFERERRVG